eukprot:6780431-Alexandrium_andersonii.AAC.1
MRSSIWLQAGLTCTTQFWVCGRGCLRAAQDKKSEQRAPPSSEVLQYMAEAHEKIKATIDSTRSSRANSNWKANENKCALHVHICTHQLHHLILPYTGRCAGS